MGAFRVGSSKVDSPSRGYFLAKVSLYGVLSFLISLIKFPLFYALSMYKLDFGEGIALLGALCEGPFFGVMVALLRFVLSILLRGTRTLFLSEMIDFISTGSLAFTCALYIKKNTIAGLLFGAFVRTFIACVLNYFIILPTFLKMFSCSIESLLNSANKLVPFISNLFDFVLYIVAPFNFIKSFFSCTLAFLLYTRIANLLEKGRVRTV